MIRWVPVWIQPRPILSFSSVGEWVPWVTLADLNLLSPLGDHLYLHYDLHSPFSFEILSWKKNFLKYVVYFHLFFFFSFFYGIFCFLEFTYSECMATVCSFHCWMSFYYMNKQFLYSFLLWVDVWAASHLESFWSALTVKWATVFISMHFNNKPNLWEKNFWLCTSAFAK